MYAIHLPRSSLFCAQAARRSGERGLISVACKGRSATNPAPASRRHTCTSDRQDGDVVMSAARSGCFQAFSPWYAGRRAPAFPECLRESMAAPKQAGTATPCPPGHTGASPGRVFRPATFTLRRTKPVASPGPLLPPSLKKIGRAAPVGAWLPRKKTL